MDRRTIGLVVPFAEDRVPDEGLAMYPDADFIARGTGVRSLSPDGYDAAIDHVVPAAEHLARAGAEAVMVIGTSLTFYRGPEFHQLLLDRLREATGLPCSTMSQAIVDGLRAFEVTRIAVATAYSDIVNDRLRAFLVFHGFEVESLESFGITDFGDGVIRRTEDEIVELAATAVTRAPAPEAVLISCGGLQTLHCARPLEERFAIPVVASTQAAFRAAFRLIGDTGELEGYGRLLEKTA